MTNRRPVDRFDPINASLSHLLSFVAATALLAGCSTYSTVASKKPTEVAVTAAQQALAASQKPFADQPLVRLGDYIDAAQDARVRLASNPIDALAQADYNFAVGRIVGIIGDASLTPWDAPVSAPSSAEAPWRLTLEPPDPRPEYHPSHFRIEPADRFNFKGKLVGGRTVKQGLGAPVVVAGKDLDFTKFDQFAQGKQVFYGLTAVLKFGGAGRCEMVLLDPLGVESVTLDAREYPLAADFQAPLALAMAELSPRRSELAGMFAPGNHIEEARLARLQQYDPDKIPVVCIHGLGDSSATWMPLIQYLRGDEQIRENFQFWFFVYPSGLPYPMAASILRSQLDQFEERYPGHKDLVLIGHSMGGMISRLLITEVGMDLWNTYYASPPDQLAVSPETRALLEKALIFDVPDDIARVIFASPSHRGSDDATSFLGRLGARLIGDPIADARLNREATSSMRPGLREAGSVRLPNSIEVLDPDNLFLKTVNALPTKEGIPFHTIIGDRGKGGNLDRTEPVSSDGIVPYWSSHMDGAVSEVIIPSNHWSIRHPLGMAEVNRILLRHLRNQP